MTTVSNRILNYETEKMLRFLITIVFRLGDTAFIYFKVQLQNTVNEPVENVGM